MRRRTLMILAAVTALAGLGGCGDRGGDAAPDAGAAPASAAAYPVTVGAVTLDKRPERIISLSPTATEMLFAIGAGKQVVAVDDQSTFPPEAPKSTLSGFKPNAEAIAAYSPDLVVVSNDIDKIVGALKALKIPVYLGAAANTLDDSYRQLADLGALTGHGAEAAAVVRQLTGDITKLVKDLPPRTKKLTYYYELDPTLYTVTSKTFVGSLFAMAGLVNVADAADRAGNGYPQLNPEALVKANPDMIFLADTRCCQQSAATVRARAGWAGITAVRTGQVVTLDDDIASRWGPRVVELVRSIVDAVAKAPA
ncbi:MAG TPA: ABC transporter substrate-binding protein [Micromonosporaceae bacterium]|nr:ABC transporter substrate-binding protein [Micromonosporaceae bacterium]